MRRLFLICFPFITSCSGPQNAEMTNTNCSGIPAPHEAQGGSRLTPENG